jgi:hypothetical protein
MLALRFGPFTQSDLLALQIVPDRTTPDRWLAAYALANESSR